MSDNQTPKTYFIVAHEMERPHVSALHVVKATDFEELRRQLNTTSWIYYNVFTAEPNPTQSHQPFQGTELKRVMFIQPTMWAKTILLGLVHEMRMKNTTPEQWEAMLEWVVDIFTAASQGDKQAVDGTVIVRKPFGVG